MGHHEENSILKKTDLGRALGFQYYRPPLLPCSSFLPPPWWWLPAPQHNWEKNLDRCSLSYFKVVSQASWNHHHFWQFQISTLERVSSLIGACTSCECWQAARGSSGISCPSHKSSLSLSSGLLRKLSLSWLLKIFILLFYSVSEK